MYYDYYSCQETVFVLQDTRVNDVLTRVLRVVMVSIVLRSVTVILVRPRDVITRMARVTVCQDTLIIDVIR